MKTLFIENELAYDGSQLAGHFAYRNFGILGDSCVGFLGPCEVKLDAMVDLEDVRGNAPIYSPLMVHFLLESFHVDLTGGVFLQRLIIARLKELLEAHGVSGLRREGDDIYQGAKKLSVSIATRSAVSTLLHIGLNVKTEGTPVPTAGLGEWGVDPTAFAKAALDALRAEYESSLAATWKVRGV